MTGGKVAFSGAVGTAILGSDTSVIDITGGTITNDTSKGGGIKGATINLGGEGNIEAAHNINITAGDGGFNVKGGAINVAEGKAVTVKGKTNISAGTVTVSGGTTSGSMAINGDLSLSGEGKIVLKNGATQSGVLSVTGTTTATTGSNLSIENGSTATFNGDASFAEGTLTAVKGSKIDMGSVTTANVERTLTVNSKDIKPLLGSAQAIKFAATGAGANKSTLVLKFNDADTEVLAP